MLERENSIPMKDTWRVLVSFTHGCPHSSISNPQELQEVKFSSGGKPVVNYQSCFPDEEMHVAKSPAFLVPSRCHGLGS